MKSTKEERKAAAAERRAKMRKLAGAVSKMTDGERLELAAKYPITTIEGRALSLHNQCLLIMQSNGVPATLVGGFRQWKRAGRSVMKGQHGMSIWIPLGKKDENGEIEVETHGKQERINFICGTVFDVTQTQETSAQEAVDEVNAEIARIESEVEA